MPTIRVEAAQLGRIMQKRFAVVAEQQSKAMIRNAKLRWRDRTIELIIRQFKATAFYREMTEPTPPPDGIAAHFGLSDKMRKQSIAAIIKALKKIVNLTDIVIRDGIRNANRYSFFVEMQNLLSLEAHPEARDMLFNEEPLWYENFTANPAGHKVFFIRWCEWILTRQVQTITGYSIINTATEDERKRSRSKVAIMANVKYFKSQAIPRPRRFGWRSTDIGTLTTDQLDFISAMRNIQAFRTRVIDAGRVALLNALKEISQSVRLTKR